ncbi:MAG: hypothetical protein IJZ96_10100 [Lachnospiraceae bacterium]|nr:hypothetical protein [Lachnospiraceae bacterium]
MTLDDRKNELRSVLKEHPNIPYYINKNSWNDFTYGYYFDEDKKTWIFFENEERGIRHEKQMHNEEEALDKMCKLVEYDIDRGR